MSGKDLSLSRIERKVLRNTFHTHNSTLKQRDLNSSVSWNCSDSNQKLMSFEESSLNSLRSLGTHLLTGLRELDLSALNFAPPLFAGKLQEAITSAPANTIITLPPLEITFSELRISSPVVLKGAPGARLVFSGGGIIVDFAGLSRGPARNFVLCEVLVSFESEQDGALFAVHSEDTSVEVRDSDISGAQGPLKSTCFWVKGAGVANRLSIVSCTIADFYEGVHSGANTAIYIEKSHFSRCGGNGVTAMNPGELCIVSSVIEQCKGSGIALQVVPDESSVLRRFSMENSDIRGAGGCGVGIWSEQLAYFPLSISLSRCKISACSKEGLAIKHLVLNELKVVYNDFDNNTRSGCWLQKVTAEDSLIVSYNRSFDSVMGYGIYLYESPGTFENNECFRNTLGGIMIAGSSHKRAVPGHHTTIRKALVSKNGENGISVLDFHCGSILLERSRICENYTNGIQLLSSAALPVLAGLRAKVAPELLGQIEIRDCTISHNRKFGLSLTKFYCSLVGSDFQGNTAGPLELAEHSENYIKSPDLPLGSPRDKSKCATSFKCAVF